jgi:hypothetical protein
VKKTDIQYIHDLLVKLDDRLDSMDQKLHSLDKTTVLQQVSLDEHIRRTNLIEQKLEPIEKHVNTVQTITTSVAKFVSGIAVLVGIVAAVREWFRNV